MSIFDRKKSQKQWREVRISAKITEGDCDVDFDEVIHDEAPQVNTGHVVCSVY